MNQIDESARHLLLKIARCGIAQGISNGQINEAPCSAIVAVQNAQSWATFQAPEPWSGNLAKAPILFLSSNPSISGTECFPKESWDDPSVVDFFNGRFNGHWVRKGRARNCDGSYGPVVRYWSCMTNRASELLGRQAVPGEDFALSEVVHCKSKREEGVTSALSTCTDRYLKLLLSCSGAVVIVLVGKKALACWNALSLDLPKVPEKEETDFLEIAGRKRVVVFLASPSGPAPKLFEHWISPDKLRISPQPISRP